MFKNYNKEKFVNEIHIGAILTMTISFLTFILVGLKNFMPEIYTLFAKDYPSIKAAIFFLIVSSLMQIIKISVNNKNKE